MGTQSHGDTYTGEQREYVARARGSGAVGRLRAGSRVRGRAGESEGGGHGELSSPKKEKGPIPRNHISVFQRS